MAAVSMPKAAMSEQDCTSRWEDEIGSARNIASMEAKAETSSV
jgi:hypothetical protein